MLHQHKTAGPAPHSLPQGRMAEQWDGGPTQGSRGRRAPMPQNGRPFGPRLKGAGLIAALGETRGAGLGLLATQHTTCTQLTTRDAQQQAGVGRAGEAQARPPGGQGAAWGTTRQAATDVLMRGVRAPPIPFFGDGTHFTAPLPQPEHGGKALP